MGVLWTVTVIAFAALYLFYLVVVNRRPHEPSIRENVLWLVFVIALTVTFVLALFLLRPAAVAVDFVSEYLTQYVLSIDALFLTASTLALFATPRAYQQVVVALAATVALGIRSVMILAGWVLTTRWVWLVFLSAALYAVRSLAVLGGESDREGLPLRVRLFNRIIPATNNYDGTRLTTLHGGRRLVSPIFLVVITIATSDMLFAPEPGDPYVLFTATALSLLLVMPLQFLAVWGGVHELLRLGRLLAVVLALICIRMLITGAAAVHITHLGPVHLPSSFAASLWISLLFAVLVTSAVVRYVLVIFGGIPDRRR